MPETNADPAWKQHLMAEPGGEFEHFLLSMKGAHSWRVLQGVGGTVMDDVAHGPELIWTSKRPQVPGNYWMSIGIDDDLIPVCLTQNDLARGPLRDCLWYGPVDNASERPPRPLL